jgi:hypothetical protein
MTLNFTKSDKDALFKEFEEYLRKKQSEIKIPVSIFSEKLSPFEAITKYLAENLSLSYANIGKQLGRDRQVVWATYRRASKKFSGKLSAAGEYYIPISYISDQKFSIFELVVSYMKDDLMLDVRLISKLLKKNTQTIWTVYYRFKKKNEK